MNDGVTINIPAMGWPFVAFVIFVVWAIRSGHFKRSPRGKRKSGKPNSKPGASKPPRKKTTTFPSSKTRRDVRVPVYNHKPNSISDIQ